MFRLGHFYGIIAGSLGLAEDLDHDVDRWMLPFDVRCNADTEEACFSGNMLVHGP